MSVNTEADANLVNAKACVLAALRGISSILLDEVHGSDEIAPTYRNNAMRPAYDKLMDARALLG